MKRLARDEGKGLAAKPAPKAGDQRKLQGDNTADKRYVAALKIMRRGGDPAKAHELLLAAAEDGDPFSIYALGTWFLHGFFVKKSKARGMSMIRVAAQKNVAWAAFDMAVSYEIGDGVKKSINQAARFYLRAFLFGDTSAAVELERLYYWELVALSGKAFSREFGRYLASIGR